MLPGLEALACPGMAVPMEVMEHVVEVESSRNPFAIGVVGGRLVRQPRRLDEALATARMLEQKGYDFSIGLAQVNRRNLAKYGLASYAEAFGQCPNLRAGSRILADCYQRSGANWDKAFSCYYSGDFSTGFRHGYVQRVRDSIRRGRPSEVPEAKVGVAEAVHLPQGAAAAAVPAVMLQPRDAGVAATAGLPDAGQGWSIPPIPAGDAAFVF